MVQILERWSHGLDCLMDRDTKLTAAFRALLDDAGTAPVRLPGRGRSSAQLAQGSKS